MQLIDSKEVDGSRAQRLRSEIQDEIASLSDTISAMDDVYHYQGYKTALENLGSDAAASADASTSAASTSDKASKSGTRP